MPVALLSHWSNSFSSFKTEARIQFKILDFTSNVLIFCLYQVTYLEGIATTARQTASIFRRWTALRCKGPFLQAIMHLYSDPTACIWTLYVTSAPFPITNGTKQGYPLYLRLFAICIESLAACIKKNPNIHGILYRCSLENLRSLNLPMSSSFLVFQF